MPHPKKVTTSGIVIEDVIYCCGGDGWKGGWSFCRIRDRMNRIYFGMRWNGDDEGVGFPNSRGKPTFMTIPEEAADALLAKFDERRPQLGSAKAASA